jgi:hypothetical protein
MFVVLMANKIKDGEDDEGESLQIQWVDEWRG